MKNKNLPVWWELWHPDYIWDVFGKSWKKPGEEGIKNKVGDTHSSSHRYEKNKKKAWKLFKTMPSGSLLQKVFWYHKRRVYIEWEKK